MNLIGNQYGGMTCRVVHGGHPSHHSTSCQELDRGACYHLSSFCLLYRLANENVHGTENKRNIQWTLVEQLDDQDFADDLALQSHTHQQIQDKTDTVLIVNWTQSPEREK